ncbi:MAG: ATP-dependent RecD-like DNA helicase [Caldilineae bacterium]|nr:MAG: ATP-dependent RecD-like DNA helicase [Caldilineae bacterium]
MSDPNQDVLRGVIERITYHNEENGYTVAKLAPERRPQHLPHWQNEVTIVGNMAGVVVGESVELRGRWSLHPQYGKQFTVERMRAVLPATVAGIEKYLGSGLVKGVGPVTAKRIVAHFGAETLEIIDNEPGRLIEVPGVGKKRVAMIRQAWAEQRAIKEVMIFLQGHGVSTSLATKIYKAYGDNAIEIVRQDPYRLARDIYGIGFLTADKIARSLGIPADSPLRIAAGVEYVLNQATDEGHVYLPSGELVRRAGELLDVGPEPVAAALLRLRAGDRIKLAPGPGEEAPLGSWAVTAVYGPDSTQSALFEERPDYSAPTPDQVQELLQESQAAYLTPLYHGEVGVANRIRRLLAGAGQQLPLFQMRDWTDALDEVERRSGLRLAPQQRRAVEAALTHRLTILTGGPGTGKTTTVRTVLELCEAAGGRALLAAPTGRAAKRLAETTGREAKTIHRLLEFQPAEGMRFKRDEDSPLDGDLLIVDEASMLDLILMNHLLKAIPSGMHLLLVGDVDQLPSVGAGNVLEDIIQAVEAGRRAEESASLWRQAAVVRLETIFRQAAGSYIIENAHRINRGQMPILDNETATDFFLFRTEDPERAAQLCVELVQTRIPRRFAIPPADIQVLSPMHRGVAGVAALNQALQQAINPPAPNKAERALGARVFRVGDRVMQVRNNYDKDVYNGDVGQIIALDPVQQNLTVVMDGRRVVYDFLELDELTHAYAISVHKSQGSEFPAVVIPILTSHYMMLQRNLLYTAVTRAQRLVVLVGQPKAIGMAVRNNRVAQRYTGLTERLQGTIGSGS